MPVGKYNTRTSIEIILCTECKGSGEIHRDELVDYHKRDYITHTTVCRICDGKGRIKRTTLITFDNI